MEPDHSPDPSHGAGPASPQSSVMTVPTRNFPRILADPGHRRVRTEGDRADTYRELFERSADPILIIEGGRFVDCNLATMIMLGYADRDEVLGAHPSELSPPTQPDGRDSIEKAAEMMALAFANGSHRFEWDHRRADGEVFPVEVLLTAVHQGDRPTLHVVWRDISERKQLEEKLRLALKMEAVGKLAGGIAHDFNNLLVAILGNAELLNVRLPAGTEEHELVDEVMHAARRAGDLTAQLLAFSRRQHLEPRVVDLNEIVGGLEGMLGRLLGAQLRFELDLDPAGVPVLVDPGQLEQVLLNLATNAKDATPAGGTVRIETGRVELDAAVIGAGERLPAGTYARLVFGDTGAGMDEDVRLQAFDPFFTTKAVGAGTGLGLSTVYGIVKQSHGDVVLASESGRGTTLTVLLPLHDGEVVHDPGPTTESNGMGSDGDELVLLVEDEPAVAHLIARVLRGHGYGVLPAANGLEALRLLRAGRAAGSEVDLVVSDVVMPELGGPELMAALGDDAPPVLFVSGYTRNALRDLRASGPRRSFLQKPFTAAALLGEVRTLLDRARA